MQLIFKVHIGLPGLHEAVLENSVGWCEASESHPHLLPAAAFNAGLAPYVYTRNKARAQSNGLRVTADSFVDSLIRYPNVVISAPQILGAVSDAYVSATSFPRADGRIGRLAKLLVDHDIEFHLFLRNPFDYFFPLSDPESYRQLEAVLAARPSWLTVIERLRRATLGRPINVWDFDRPSIMSADLRSTVLGPAFEEPIYDEGEDFYEAPKDLRKLELPDQTQSRVLEAICSLDAQYHTELDRLEVMSGVNLFRSPRAPWA